MTAHLEGALGLMVLGFFLNFRVLTTRIPTLSFASELGMSPSKDGHLFSTKLKIFLADGIIFWLAIARMVSNHCI